jgi:hypothetical protein
MQGDESAKNGNRLKWRLWKCVRICLMCFLPRLPLWSSGQLQIQRSGFDFQRYQIFWEIVGLEWGPLNLMSTIEELIGRKSSSSGLESREYNHRDLSRRPCGTFYPQKLELTSPTSGSCSFGIVRSQTQAMEFSFIFHSKIMDSLLT